MKDEKTYRIAFFTVDWNYELVESTLHGLKQYTDDHPNVYISVFDCFGKNLDNAKDKSEYAIFNLADLSQFDGLLIQGNQIVLQRVRDEVGARITETGIPAVSIGCPMPGCTLMRIDRGESSQEQRHRSAPTPRPSKAARVRRSRAFRRRLAFRR